ncbi:DUF6580 family putative transport protein [Tundrisphaera sp. TA3]|uniref:DUF6580 family putative transport protein n=1 Tax=Tundrisphaera sp. TA3 TaxID=3435775 RepID=UPI003EBF5D32
MNRPRFWFLAALTLTAALSRLLPHPHNFSPVAAVALLGGAAFPKRWAAILVPLASLFLSDVLLQVTYALSGGQQPFWGFYPGQVVVYACLVATVGIGFLIRDRRTVPTVALATLASSVLFFLVTNAAYVFEPTSPYPKNLNGVMLSYGAALPFFQNALLGDAFFATVLFGLLALAESLNPALRDSAKPALPELA